MSKRKAIPKSVRFEVFKRDKFTCQYCGAKAPDSVLHVDHINPVANGGDNAILNLVTACAACNGGNSDRLLDDRSAVERQRAQVEDLQTRREQLEMMLEWRDSEQAARTDIVEAICLRLEERGGYVPNENGKNRLRRGLKRFTVEEILTALDEAFDAYMQFDGDDPVIEAWDAAFKKIPAIANLRRQAKERPHVVKVAYVQAILRRRFQDPRGNYFEALESFIVDDAVSPDTLEDIAKVSASWDDFCDKARAKSPKYGYLRQPLQALEPVYSGYEEDEEEQEPEPDGYGDDGYDRDGADD